MDEILKRTLVALFSTVFIIRRSYRKQSLSTSGCFAAFFVGVTVTTSSFCHFAALLAFFFTSNKATRFRQSDKKKIDYDFKPGGQRNAIQVLCNGLWPIIFSIAYMISLKRSGEITLDFSNNFEASFSTCAVLASFGCSCGDTLASELGPVLGNSKSQPAFHIIQLKNVPKGTNGGVSFYGTIASGIGGIAVGLGYYIALAIACLFSERMNLSVNDLGIIFIGGFSGFIGSLIDSILGGSLQFSGLNEKTGTISNKPGPYVKHIAGYNVLTNNQVNLISGLITSLSVPYLTSLFF